MNIAVEGNNFFHTGWLACFLGLPRKHPRAAALKSCDVASFEDGWDTCHETVIDGLRVVAFRRMVVAKQAEAFWQDDDGNPIES